MFGFVFHLFVQLVICHGFSVNVEVFYFVSSFNLFAVCNMCIVFSVCWSGRLCCDICFAYSDLRPLFVVLLMLFKSCYERAVYLSNVSFVACVTG
jgi:hypothetical protein